MVRSVIGGIFVLACLNLSHGEAGNPEYHCQRGAVDSDAIAVAFPGVDVSAFSNPNDKVCTFAIGGASPDGPSSGVTKISQTLGQALSGELQPLLLRLMIARPKAIEAEGKYVEGTLSLMKENEGAISDCINAILLMANGGDQRNLFAMGAELPKPEFSSGDGTFIYVSRENDIASLLCAVHSPTQGETFRSDYPTFRLYARSHTDGSSDSLFIPSEAVK